MAAPTTTATAEELEELVLCARYGESDDLDFIKELVQRCGKEVLINARDERGNTCVHMAGANGHVDVLSYILPLLPPSSLSTPNSSGSTPLHWAALNFHLSPLRLLCPLLPTPAFSLLNSHGKTALQEAEERCEAFVVPEGGEETEQGKERARREETVGYLIGYMEGRGILKIDKESERVVREQQQQDEEQVKAVEGLRIDG